jgi:CubicO group peptidase (beta-lactamase class C family)
MIVAKNGSIVFEKYVGTGHLNGTDTITANTPTHIASVSKTFTAMAVLKLVQDGKINLDDEFNKYFPAFNYPGITIRNLLSHRSGLPNYLYFMDELGWDKKRYMKNQDVFDYLVNRKAELKDISSPDTHFTYCNTNYALLALLIEKISGLSYPEYMRITFFVPLQMTNSFVYVHADSAKANPSYDWRGGLIPTNALDEVYGDKNVYTTPRDLLKWDRLLSTNLLFKPEILAAAYAPYSNEKPGIRNYGLGWRMNIYPNGKKLIYHNGWWHGNNAAFIRLLDEDATIIVMGNKFCRGIYKAKNLLGIFDPALATETEDETENSRQPEPATQK